MRLLLCREPRGRRIKHFPPTKNTRYKCLFNHELLIAVHNPDNNPQYVKSFITKLKDTDVDAVMCCSMAWRTNLYPSEIDLSRKKCSPNVTHPKFPAYDWAMKYLNSGGDFVRDTLEACRESDKAFFISYRMNDPHHVDDKDFPTHDDFWRENPHLLFGDSKVAFRATDDARLFNYMHAEVRDHYFAILKELALKYDIDGLELDFQRYPKYFYKRETEKGKLVMTDFVKRVRAMLDEIGKSRGKRLKLSVRIPHKLELCSQAGLDPAAWDGTVDMADISSYYINTTEADIESFKKMLPNAKIYGEINYVTRQMKSSSGMQARRFTNVETYRRTAFSYLSRGADGICLFNFDYIVDPNGWEDTVDKFSPAYVPLERRESLAKEIKGISDVEFLKRASKNYVINNRFDSLKKSDDENVRIIIPDDTSRFKFSKAVLRVETDKPCADLDITASLNGTKLEMFKPVDTELFKPISVNEATAARDCLKFYIIPLDKIVCGENAIDIKNLSAAKASRKYVSIELGIYE